MRSRPDRDPDYTVIAIPMAASAPPMAGPEVHCRVESRREIDGKITDETRFYITSLLLLAEAIGP